MKNLDNVLKSRDITLLTKAYLVKAMVFLVVMYGCESWTIKKAGCRRINAFKLWCWRRLLRVPWTAKRSKQSILREINPEYSLEGLLLKLKLQYFGHLMQRANSLEKTLMLERLRARGEASDREWDGWMASLTQWTWVSKLRETVKDREAWSATVHGVAKSQIWLSDWTRTISRWGLSYYPHFVDGDITLAVKEILVQWGDREVSKNPLSQISLYCSMKWEFKP